MSVKNDYAILVYEKHIDTNLTFCSILKSAMAILDSEDSLTNNVSKKDFCGLAGISSKVFNDYKTLLEGARIIKYNEGVGNQHKNRGASLHIKHYADWIESLKQAIKNTELFHQTIIKRHE